jgi:1,4-dihydroxy-2-naphthoyl-CoA hydrolase
MSSIWKKDVTLEDINHFSKNSIVGNVGIEFVEKGDDFLTATMPVDKRTIQPLGILHGGASAVLAETLGSMASHMTLDENHHSVGLEIKANHIKSVTKGVVTGRVKPVHLGKTTQIWDTEIRNEKDQMVCISRLTMVVLNNS